MDLACNASEIMVMIRDKECMVTELTRTTLVCKVPTFDSTDEKEGSEEVQVVVSLHNVPIMRARGNWRSQRKPVRASMDRETTYT